MKFTDHGSDFGILPATIDDAPAIRKLVNAAYKELADRGLNYTAADQDEEKTRERLAAGYEIVGEWQYEGKTYASWIFEKPL